MTPPRVVALALDGLVTFDLACATQVFGGDDRDDPPPLYRFEVCAVRRGRVVTADGLVLSVANGLEALQRADLVVVPGYVPVAPAPPRRALAAVRAAHARGARVLSICTGAFLLAHAGLLDGRRATTHWSACRRLADAFPAVRVQPDVLYVDEGDVLTSAGVAAGLDLCLHVVRNDHGVQAATDIARWTVVAPHREGGQAQFVDTPVPEVPSASLGATRAWALARLHEPLDVPALAAHACCSTRTFARRFKAETGCTPKQWLLAARVRRAQHLLETTDLNVDEVARHAGFGNAAALRVHFERITTRTPSAYRAAFRGVTVGAPASS
jgi:AraC family transcriptional regulator, transcriptional activator FtrA